jgi:non-specific protein-tyrosine kinase
LVLEALDRRLKDSADVEAATGQTALGVVPFALPGEQIPAMTHPRSARAEAYRQVRTNLAFTSESGPPKSVIITSSASSEGKTSLAANLAITAARTGQRVVLVDADLRRPMVHTYLGLPNKKGLVNVLAGTVDLADAVESSTVALLDVLVAGPVPTNPSELLGSETMLKTIRRLESLYELVIIDTPPVLPVTDALVIAVHVDAVVVMARLGQTTRDRIRRTTVALEHVNAHIAGVVPNGAVQREDSAYYYAYRYRSKREGYIPYPVRKGEAESAQESTALRPALQRNGKSHTPSAKSNGSQSNGSQSNGSQGENETSEPRGKHVRGRGGTGGDVPAPPTQS